MQEIVTERLVLRLLQPEDVPAFAASATTPTSRGTSRGTKANVSSRPNRASTSAIPGRGCRWPRATGALCGDCAVRVAADQPRTAEVGVTFAPANQGSGLATEALGAVVARLFDQHHIHRVYARADDRNVPVQRLLERLGFRCEARLVEADWFEGEWTTLRVYATLGREWQAT